MLWYLPSINLITVTCKWNVGAKGLQRANQRGGTIIYSRILVAAVYLVLPGDWIGDLSSLCGVPLALACANQSEIKSKRQQQDLKI